MHNEKFFKQLEYSRLSIEGLAENIGMDRSTLYRRLDKNGRSFTVEEIYSIARLLSLSKRQVNEIFFNDKIDARG